MKFLSLILVAALLSVQADAWLFNYFNPYLQGATGQFPLSYRYRYYSYPGAFTPALPFNSWPFSNFLSSFLGIPPPAPVTPAIRAPAKALLTAETPEVAPAVTAPVGDVSSRAPAALPAGTRRLDATGSAPALQSLADYSPNYLSYPGYPYLQSARLGNTPLQQQQLQRQQLQQQQLQQQQFLQQQQPFQQYQQPYDQLFPYQQPFQQPYQQLFQQPFQQQQFPQQQLQQQQLQQQQLQQQQFPQQQFPQQQLQQQQLQQQQLQQQQRPQAGQGQVVSEDIPLSQEDVDVLSSHPRAKRFVLATRGMTLGVGDAAGLGIRTFGFGTVESSPFGTLGQSRGEASAVEGIASSLGAATVEGGSPLLPADVPPGELLHDDLPPEEYPEDIHQGDYAEDIPPEELPPHGLPHGNDIPPPPPHGVPYANDIPPPPPQGPGGYYGPPRPIFGAGFGAAAGIGAHTVSLGQAVNTPHGRSAQGYSQSSVQQGHASSAAVASAKRRRRRSIAAMWAV